ncbi:hypothetical protein CYMTET_31582 [Cymbomonas tetramitiformis]|uniref:ABC transporter domain-containing protein n=1 Tax=Cymbomonas tetramitiformis TaxID=36881 RepID=A0AAE0FGS1_9CHLO|nr:hypothetical protein CYMTET_31582 [Cymbomonas tetramitiformis]
MRLTWLRPGFRLIVGIKLGGWVHGRAQAGQLTNVVHLTHTVGGSLSGLTTLHKSLLSGACAAARIAELEDNPRLVEQPGGTILSELKGAIKFTNINFCYPTRPETQILRNFNLELQPGEVFALVGESGGGKSTIGQLLQRLYDPQTGDITIDEVGLVDLDQQWLRRHIGVVSQEPTLFSGSILNNIRYARPQASQEAVETRRSKPMPIPSSKFPDGYHTLVGERGAQLSGGQRQRIAIARALLAEPKVLLLDEATSALDAESELLVQEALERAMQGRTTIVIAHRLSTVCKADRIGLLQDGELKEIGTHRALMAKGGDYAKLAKAQLGE